MQLNNTQLATLKTIVDQINAEIEAEVQSIKTVTLYDGEGEDGEQFVTLDILAWRTRTAEDEHQAYRALDVIEERIKEAGLPCSIEYGLGDSTDGILHGCTYVIVGF